MGDAAELVARTADGASISLPRELLHLMASVLEELAQGHAVAVVSEAKEVGTSAAAAFLGVSRPHVVRLIDSGLLPHRRAGTHRRVRLADLAAYKRRVERRHAFLDDLGTEAADMGRFDPAVRSAGE
jgi:excisionase family DNA binding protein